jgi:hypothetical protein
MVQLIYCAAGSTKFAEQARACHWDYGAKLPDRTYTRDLAFVDNDWRNPDLPSYKAAIEEFRPETATVRDWDETTSLDEVLMWAEELAPIIGTIIIIPKLTGTIDQIPHVIGGRRVVLGFSVWSSWSGTAAAQWEFGKRPVHLLGGSPANQLRLGRYLNVVSADINYFHVPSKKGRLFHGGALPKGREKHWGYLSEIGKGGMHDGVYEAFRLSLSWYQKVWQSRR